MRAIHSYKTWISFGETDPAKLIYFARIFDIAHRCLEDFSRAKKFYDKWFVKGEWLSPVRHTEAEYLKPIRPGDEITVHMFAHKKGSSSFTWRYEIHKDTDVLAKVYITHVHIDRASLKPISVPEDLAHYFTLT